MKVRSLAAALTLALSTVTAQAETVSAHQSGQNTGQSALAKLRLTTGLDGAAEFKTICGAGSPAGATERQIVAASGFDTAAIPYAAVDEPEAFCACALQVAAQANRIAAKRLGLSGKQPALEELANATLVPGKAGSSASCRASGWRVDFTASGLALYRNGVPVFGGDRQVVGGKTIEITLSVSQSWDQ